MVAWAFAYALCTQYPDFNKIFVSICFQLLQRGCLSKRERDDDSLPSMARIAYIFAVYIVVRHSSHCSLHHAKWRIKTSHTRNKNKIIGRRDESIQAINAQMDWKFHRSTENQSNFRKTDAEQKNTVCGTLLRFEVQTIVRWLSVSFLLFYFQFFLFSCVCVQF